MSETTGEKIVREFDDDSILHYEFNHGDRVDLAARIDASLDTLRDVLEKIEHVVAARVEHRAHQRDACGEGMRGTVETKRGEAQAILDDVRRLRDGLTDDVHDRWGIKRCGVCGEHGHNRRTCQSVWRLSLPESGS